MNAILSFAASLAITVLAHHYATAKKVMDIPNHRSSHTQPTPRGGGISFVVTFSAYLAVSGLQNKSDWRLVAALLGGGLAVALVGFLDDHRGLSPRFRLFVHLVAGCWAVYWAGPSQLDLGIMQIACRPLVTIMGLLIIVWFTNLFNFMDGIDGLASLEAITCGFSLWGLTRTTSSQLSILALAFASSVSGFLPMNWSPARIFMGDVGSGYLGFTIGTLAITSAEHGGPPFWVWAVLCGVFVVDATLTLIRRVLQGESWQEPHRTHVYQLAVQAGLSHARVTLAVGLMNVLLFLGCYFHCLSPGALVILTYVTLSALHVFLYRRWTSLRVDLIARGIQRAP